VTTTTTAQKATPQQNRERKARLIARAAWLRDLTGEDLAAMPYSGEARCLTRFARLAYRESPDPADHDLNPPSSYESRTWRIVEEKLTRMAALYTAGQPVPARHLLHERQAWLPEENPCPNPGSTSNGSPSASPPSPRGPSESSPPTDSAPDAGIPTTARSGDPALRPSSPATTSSGQATAGAVVASSPSSADAPPTLPRGWAELAALPPLDYRSCINHPDRRPIVITPDGGRCGDCPPRRAELHPDQAPPGQSWTGLRDGWGITLNWAPKHCNGPTVRCYCGRCPKGT
jgi:hypothetical protein